jgi:uncharacterized protein (DUF1499 family)
MQTSFLFIIFVVLLGAGWIRFAPTDVDAWHVDPATANDPGAQGFRVIGREAPRFSGDPVAVLEALIAIARAEPRVRRLDGSVDEGMLTFVAHTKWVGFRDYITVKAVAEGSATKLSAISRSRYSYGSDRGVNRERMERWFAELEDIFVE